MPDSQKPFEKKILPHGKPILCKFGSIPKEGKPQVFEGKTSARIHLKFWVADNKYPELNGYPVFYRCNPWINGGNDGRETFLFGVLTEMAGAPLPREWVGVDARDLTEAEWKKFYGYYVLRMKEPDLNEDGSFRWQDIDEILHPAGIEFPVDSRRMERVTPSGPIGLPKANTPAQAPVETPPAAPGPKPNPFKLNIAPETPTTPIEPLKPGPAPQGKPEAEPIANVIGSIQELWKPESPLKQVLADFLTAKGKAKVKELPDAEIRLLYTIMLVASYMVSDSKYETEVTAMLGKWHQKLVELKQPGADLLLRRLNEMASGTDPFASPVTEPNDPFAD